MANTITSIEIPASPTQVWQLIGGFDALQIGYHISLAVK